MFLGKQNMNILEIREKIKESIRKKRKTESGSVVSSTGSFQKNLPCDNFGTFFGPSERIVAQRLMKLSMPEVKIAEPKTKTSLQGKTKTLVHLIEKQKKIERFRYTRDYSFLNSPDSDLPKLPEMPAVQCLGSVKPQKSSQVRTKPVPEPVVSSPQTPLEFNKIKTHQASDGLKHLASKPVSGSKRGPEHQRDLVVTKKQKLVPVKSPQVSSSQLQNLGETKKAKLVPDKTPPLKQGVPQRCPKISSSQLKKVPCSTKPKMSAESKDQTGLTREKSSVKQQTRRPGVFEEDDMESEFESILQVLSRGRGRNLTRQILAI